MVATLPTFFACNLAKLRSERLDPESTNRLCGDSNLKLVCFSPEIVGAT